MLNGSSGQLTLRRGTSEASRYGKETLHWWPAASWFVSLTRSGWQSMAHVAPN